MSDDRLRASLRGAMTALATPFKDGAVDYAALSALVEWQVAEGIGGLVPCTPTGEALQREPDPVALKYALHLQRGIGPELRLPLTAATVETAEAVRLALRAGLDGEGESRTAPAQRSRAIGLC